MSEREITIADDAQDLSARAAEEIVRCAGDAIRARGTCTLCLTGGTTPAATYERLATHCRSRVAWNAVQFWWGDERCVPPDDPASNFGLALHTMLGTLTIAPAQIHRIAGEDPPDAAARAYEADLRDAFGLGPTGVPRFDLLLLGLGENCHVLSLFPGIPELHEQTRLAVPVVVADAIPRRVSLTVPVMNASARLMLIVSGGNKAAAVRRVLEGNDESDQVPARLIGPRDGVVLWMLDKAAASQLSELPPGRLTRGPSNANGMTRRPTLGG
ncbi:MAG TPA: 6-phosphogluconolactonase [Gemmatimonadaceae bacterium]|nr:6-phosphogluconolactonase [Gemmatimonadaceae bacterium]